jgi:hypothetical protein
MTEKQNDESYRTSKNTQIKSGGCPTEPAKTLMDLQVKAYENRLRERLIAKYSTRTLSEAKRLEKEIENLFRFTLREEFCCREIHRTASAEGSV